VKGKATHIAIFGGSYNIVEDGDYHTVGGGTNNTITTVNEGSRHTISGGGENSIDGETSRGTISGGGSNSISSSSSTIGGGLSNVINALSEFGYIGGGQSNSITGTSGNIAGGLRNTIINDNCTIGGGNDNTSSGVGSTVNGGVRNTASGYASAVNSGADNIASGDGAGVLCGEQNIAKDDYSVASGVWAETKMGSQYVISGGRFADRGDAQASIVALRRLTTSATPLPLRTNGGSGLVAIADNTTYTFKCLVIGREEGGDDVASFEVVGCVSRNVGAASVRIVGTPTINVIGPRS
jgi:hypothetical protein